MADFTELRKLPQPRRVAELTPEAQRFKAFKLRSSQAETGRVVNLAFCPTAPHSLAVVSGTKVGLWIQGQRDGELELEGKISKFKDVTQCASWRNDGKLLLAGEASGSCALVETETKKVLRRFRGHGDAVTCASFASSDKTQAATGGRDGRLRLWDVVTCELLHTVDAHSDCMKYLGAGPGGPDSWISAGYDGKMKLWDIRIPVGSGEGSAVGVASVDHAHPIEAAVAFPRGSMIATAGGTEVSVWDLTFGGRPVQALSDAHSKTITAVCLDNTASVLLTASFDGLAKVYHAAGLSHLWTYKLPAPATCAAWRPDDRAFAIGLDNGQWQLRQRRPAADDAAAASDGDRQACENGKRKSSSSWLRTHGRFRGMDSQHAPDDEVVEPERPRRKKVKQVDFFLKKFEYRKAVEFMVEPSSSPDVGLAIVEELLQRGALRAALRDLGEELCLTTLRWLLKAFGSGDKLEQQLLFEALHTLLDSNRCLQPPSTPELVAVVAQFENKVMQEIKIHEALAETSGILRMVMSV